MSQNTFTITLKYNPRKISKSGNVVIKNIDQYQESLYALKHYDLSHDEWLINVKNVSEKLNFLRQSYRVINTIRKRNMRNLDVTTKLTESESDDGSGTDLTPKRITRRTVTNN